MARVTGIGGIFFKCADPKALAEWYRDVIGFAIEDWGGAMLKADPEGAPHAVWGPFGADTKYFAPSEREFMINFAVDDMDAMVARLTAKGVPILKRAEDANGKFAWILDPDGTKIELWQPK